MSCVLLNLLFLFVHITWLTVVSAQTTASPEFYDYNRISFTQLDNIDELKRHFFNYITPNGDESEGISNTNLVVGVATDSCMHKLLNCSAFKGIQV